MEKGPFVIGSSMVIQELNNNLSPNGVTYNTTTNDNLGSYLLQTEVETEYLELICSGFYFNEVLGSVSNESITLRTIISANINETNINILTTLATKRITHLISGTGMPYEDAKTQAEAEVLDIFNISDSEISFNSISVQNNPVLLAISSILQANSSVSQLSVLMSSIIEDIKEDGILDSESIKDQLIANASILNPGDIKANLQSYYNSLGLNIEVPDFSDYIAMTWENTPPHCEILSMSTYDGTEILQVFVPMYIDYNVSDIDDNLSTTEIYLDGVCIESSDSDRARYQFTITDTSSIHHQIVLCTTDAFAATFSDTLNFEINDCYWIELESSNFFFPNYYNGESYSFLELDDVLYRVGGKDLYTSSDGVNFQFHSELDVNDLGNDHSYKIEGIFNSKIWITSNTTTYYSLDFENWEYVSGGNNKGIFELNNETYLLQHDSSYTDLFIFELNNWVQITNNDLPSNSYWTNRVKSFNNEVIIDGGNGKSSGRFWHSSDLENWEYVEFGNYHWAYISLEVHLETLYATNNYGIAAIDLQNNSWDYEIAYPLNVFWGKIYSFNNSLFMYYQQSLYMLKLIEEE